MLHLEPRGNPWESNSVCISVTVIDNKNNNNKNNKVVDNGLDFILSHFNQEQLFPRKISTSKLKGKQVEVFSKQEALKMFEESNFVDCRINSFPSYTEYKEFRDIHLI